MKLFVFPIDKELTDMFFRPIRNKEDVVLLLMNSIKFVHSAIYKNPDNPIAEMVLRVDKHSRLFFFGDKKSFSVTFPFFVYKDEHKHSFVFSSADIPSIDSRITSAVIATIKDRETFDSREALAFVDPLLELEDVSSSFWPFFLKLLTFEAGYIRYDFDAEYENEDLHPLIHYDIFYSAAATCKIGLRHELERDKMIDLLDTTTACHYFEAQE